MIDWKRFTQTVTKCRRNRNVLFCPLPDNDLLRSLASFTKPIPKKSKDVERLRQQNASGFQQLRYEIHLLHMEQRRMSHNTMSQMNASVQTYSLYHSKRHGPPERFYSLP